MLGGNAGGRFESVAATAGNSFVAGVTAENIQREAEAMAASNQQNEFVATGGRSLKAEIAVGKLAAVEAMAESNLTAAGVIIESNWTIAEETVRKERVAVAEMAENRLAEVEGRAESRESAAVVVAKLESK